jgi:hypothetical protein
MANIPWVKALQLPGKTYLIVVSSATKYDDGFKGCWWHAYDTNGELVNRGFSEGSQKYGGIGSALMAMKNAKQALRRQYEREAVDIYVKSRSK